MRSTCSIICLLLLCAFGLRAQIPVGGTPPSLQPTQSRYFADKPLPRQALPTLDIRRILEEDAQGPDVRFAAPIRVDYSLETSGQWTELPNGDRVWRLNVYSRGAKALLVFYRDFYLPPGAQLFMYSPDGRQVIGAYTSADNPEDGRFMTGLLYGDAALIEYLEPAAVRGQGHFRIDRIDHAYKPVGRSEQGTSRSPALGFGASLACHIGADCPDADPVAELKRSVCRILVVVEEGTGYCTGNLMNNTAEDAKPYVYTGFHCMDGYTPIYSLWRFDFSYRSTGCDPPVNEPQFNSITGSTFRAGRRQNDFLLLELDQPVPTNYAPYYMGWNRQETPPDTSYMLHHPRGDVQKFSWSTEQATIQTGPIRWNNEVITPRNHHFDVDFTEGNYEVGSSGAALINTKQQMVGHLNGGNPDTVACEYSQGWFGRLSLAWEGGGTADTRLKDWLDPTGSDVMELGGFAESQPATVTGTILTYFDEEPVAGVEVSLSLDGNAITVTSAADGSFIFTNVGVANTYTVSFSKNTAQSNGVSGMDILDIQRHILSLTPLNGPYRLLAADVNDSGSITAQDVIAIRKVILAVVNEFAPGIESWVFLPKGYTFPSPDKPWSPAPAKVISSNNVEELQDLKILAIKRGDVNDSADGKK
jgi:hypothetical protein